MGLISETPEWRNVTIPTLGSFYLVSNHGEVRSVDRVICDRLNRKTFKPGRTIRQFSSNKYGHMTVGLWHEAKGVRFASHRLVALAFIGAQPEGHEVCHIDGNPKNNHVSNLRWGTKSSNSLDRRRHGTDHEVNKTHCPRGHELVPPNLVRSMFRRGHRTCLACARGKAYVHRHRDADFTKTADRYHSELMSREILL